MTDKIEKTLKDKFLNQDGTINKTTLVSFVSLLIVLVDQLLGVFGVTPHHQDQIVAMINTLLTVLSVLGFVEGSANDQVTAKPVDPAPVTKQAIDNAADKSTLAPSSIDKK
ncbi:hypothetical protein [Limosilactobacillus antri]|uniref:hypothetical protein n=1 Tax=Limosilactobacillus antri TaxID=227943 RepID=UPI001F595B98|nr:hypothetical protein [Limosilactobacillus antri]